MKKTLVILAALWAVGQTGFATGATHTAAGNEHTTATAETPDEAEQPVDSMRMVQLQGIQVVANRAGEKTPVAYTNVNRAVLEKFNTGVDLPFLLLSTPSVVATSEAGAGVGYTTIRIRGTDATRINVTANGIPMNDAESHGLFWVNMPDITASVEDIQIQRGVGTSTNGAGAFGGSINLRTQNIAPTAYGELSGSYGSFNTHRESVNFGTGLLGGHWAFNARLSQIHSDGYRNNASTSLKSYFLQGGYYGRNTVVKFITFAGKEKTFHAWDAVSKYDMATYGRRYNPCGEIWGFEYDASGNLVKQPDKNGKLKPVSKFLGFYKDQTDNYDQKNYQLHFSQRLTDRLNLNAALHYTDGFGYYEQYKGGAKLLEYALTPFVPADPDNEPYYDSKTGTVTKSDVIRRKVMDNGFGGGMFSLDYKSPKLEATFGGAANKYNGDHFGNVTWVQNYYGDPEFLPGHQYYNNRGEKFDANIFLKATWNVTEGLYLYGDLQYRHINYKIKGENDKWDTTAGAMQILDVNENYDFFNPKAGISYDINPNWNVYASVAVVGKEPTRNNFTDAEPGENPTSERLTDYEAGFTFRNPVFSAGVNLYYMKYKDQLVLTGEVNHIGEMLAKNVPDSYRAGVELMAGVMVARGLRWDVNATLSTNKIKNYTNQLVVDQYTGEHVSTYLGKTTIAFSPSVTAGSLISYNIAGFNASLQTNVVGKQYVNNSESRRSLLTDLEDGSERLELNAYTQSNLHLDYTFKIRSMRSVTVGVTVYNLFNAKYSSNGYEWTQWKTDDDYNFVKDSNGNLIRQQYMYYFPQAGTNVLANVTLRF